ncbi:integrase core domain-containing protein [Acrocarpospora pleiomorpha]|uniref:integrase core domain-containing protein n=1 Tax=Acrocarpospora pleiomorpha TaxID=90975 RepID=UPI0035A258EC
MKTLRRELLDRMLILNEQHLRRTLTRYLEHYNTARPHRGSGSCLHRKPKPDRQPWSTSPMAEFTAEPSSAGSSTSTRSAADTTKNPQARAESHA